MSSCGPFGLATPLASGVDPSIRQVADPPFFLATHDEAEAN
jgi:hypothetical protein